jgi:hypothetical protein
MTALARLDQDHLLARLVRFSPEWAPAVMGRIQPFADGSFQYAEGGGRDALLYPVELDDGDVIDTVAWFPTNPRKWWRAKLTGTHLGDRSRRRAAFLQEPIRLLATPADWAASPTGAVCVIDWGCDLRALFREVPAIQCASRAPGMAARMARGLERRLAEQVHHRFKITTVRL